MNQGIDTEGIADNLLDYLRDELKNNELEYASTLTQIRGGYETSIYLNNYQNF